MGDITNLVLLVPEAERVLAAANALVPPGQRLTTPAHIKLVYPFIPPEALTPAARAERVAFFNAVPPLTFELGVGWFGREVLLLQPSPAGALVELTQATLDRWPDYPYYGGAYDEIVPHLSLAFGTAEMLERIASEVERFTPISTTVRDVKLLIGPHERMTPRASFALGGRST